MLSGIEMEQPDKTSKGKEITRKSKIIMEREAVVPGAFYIMAFWVAWRRGTGLGTPQPSFDPHFWTCPAYSDSSSESVAAPRTAPQSLPAAPRGHPSLCGRSDKTGMQAESP